MKGILVFEGADSAGKTTLARRIVGRFGARYLHQTVRKDIWRWHVGGLRRGLRLADRGLVVMDRHWISEQIYGAAYRARPGYNVPARCMDRVLQRNSLTILCVPADREEQAARWARNRSEGKFEHFDRVEEVIKLYYDLAYGNAEHKGHTYVDQLIRRGQFVERKDVMIYDLNKHGDNMDRFIDRALVRLSALQALQFPPALFSDHQNFAGHLDGAEYLFLGEEVAPRVVQNDWPRWPFVWGDKTNDNCALWINDALHRMEFDETKAIWANAMAMEDRFNELLEEVRRRHIKVLAFGKVAQARLHRHGYYQARKVPHPQWAKRFTVKVPYEKYLKEGMF